MNEHDASRIAREGLDQTLETGAENRTRRSGGVRVGS
jgi:hypothetical protein